MIQFKKVQEILSKIGIKKKHSKLKNLEKVLETIEKKYKAKLPALYKKFLLEYGGAFFESDFIYKSKDNSLTDGYNDIEIFYGLDNSDYSLPKQIECYIDNKDFIPNYLLPIADAPGGDVICLGMTESHFNKVYFWAHDVEEGKNIVLIADSFYDFIKTFTIIENEEDNGIKPKRVWLSDDLLND